MLTVRFQTGVSIQYNTANYVVHGGQGTWTLYDQKGGRVLALIQAGAGAVVELTPACKIHNPTAPTLNDCQARVLSELQGCGTAFLWNMKATLANFNGRSGSWKG